MFSYSVVNSDNHKPSRYWRWIADIDSSTHMLVQSDIPFCFGRLLTNEEADGLDAAPILGSNKEEEGEDTAESGSPVKHYEVI